nr:uncharacterized protein LOC113693356 [Coffea arabica]
MSGIGRELEYWENPNEFLPERCLNISVDMKGKDFQLIPFGAGRRGCPRYSLGLAMVEVGLAVFSCSTPRYFIRGLKTNFPSIPLFFYPNFFRRQTKCTTHSIFSYILSHIRSQRKSKGGDWETAELIRHIIRGRYPTRGESIRQRDSGIFSNSTDHLLSDSKDKLLPEYSFSSKWNVDFNLSRVAMHVLVVYRDQLDSLRDDHFVWQPYPQHILETLPQCCLASSEL